MGGVFDMGIMGFLDLGAYLKVLIFCVYIGFGRNEMGSRLHFWLMGVKRSVGVDGRICPLQPQSKPNPIA